MILYQEALRSGLEKCLNDLMIHRTAQAKDTTFQAVVNELKAKINEVQAGHKHTVADNWKSLKKRG